MNYVVCNSYRPGDSTLPSSFHSSNIATIDLNCFVVALFGFVFTE